MTTNVAKQYAIALFSLASKKKITDDIFTDFKQLLSGFNDLVWRFFLNPRIEDDDKKNLFEKSTDNKLLNDFLKTVIDNKRIDSLQDIFEAYKYLLNDSKNIAEINVYTKTPLTKANKEKLINKFSNNFNKKIIINEVIKPNIVGGIRIDYRGQVLDQTINAFLDDLKASLIG